MTKKSKQKRKTRVRASGARPTDKWWLEKAAPQIVGKGNYEATIAATDHPTGLSACAWEIGIAGYATPVLAEARPSRRRKSDEQRGYVAAALGAIAAFEGNVKLTIYTNSSYVVDGLNGNAENWKLNGWKANDWKFSGGREIKNSELWEKILELIAARSISVSAIKISKDDFAPYSRTLALAQESLHHKSSISKKFDGPGDMPISNDG